MSETRLSHLCHLCSYNLVRLHHSYYLQRYHKDDKTKVLAFPEEFKMLAGDPFRRTYNEKNEVDQAIGTSSCLHVVSSLIPQACNRSRFIRRMELSRLAVTDKETWIANSQLPERSSRR